MLTWLFVPILLVLGWALLLAVVGWAIQAAEAGQPVRYETRVLAALLREACARVLLRAVGPFSGRATRPVEAIAAAKERRLPPVVLICGLTWRPGSLLFMRRFLVQRGWRWVVLAPRGGPNSSLAAEAEALAHLVAEVRRVSGSPQVDLVGFSSGGLVAGWYLRHHGEGAASVRRVVSLATPWRGTKIAVFGRGTAAREVRVGSHLLDDLWPPPVPTVCIWSAEDGVVVPASSAAPSDATETVCIEAAGHVELLISPRALRAVQAALEHPLTEPPHPSAAPTLIPDVVSAGVS